MTFAEWRAGIAVRVSRKGGEVTDWHSPKPVCDVALGLFSHG